MPRLSVFDMMKIGVGPSSSHTLGPWRAALRFLQERAAEGSLAHVTAVSVDLYGSLAKTGRGHGTDVALLLGLRGEDPVTYDTALLDAHVAHNHATGEVNLLGRQRARFVQEGDIRFNTAITLPYHPNGLTFTAVFDDGRSLEQTYYSVGGGFVVREGEEEQADPQVSLPYPADNAAQVLAHCLANDLALWEMVWANEQAWRDAGEIREGLQALWMTMLDAVYRGCHTDGRLPGGLSVTRRAARIHRQLMGDGVTVLPLQPSAAARDEWLRQVKARSYDFPRMIKWVSCFALAVNEENAAFGRVVTAPTNGAAGVIPAVLLYYAIYFNATEEDIMRFLLVAGEVGTLFKKGATISAALGGCQAEIGVSSAMAAAALCERLGGTPQQALMAAEIAMEHHLGLTCDPVAGLVQIPCIERNAMGAMKAITAANLAVESEPGEAKISLDGVIRTMWETAMDMSEKYKETSEGGLANLIPVNLAEC